MDRATNDHRVWLGSLLRYVVVVGVVLALVVGACALVLGAIAAARQAYEPLPTAEFHCASVFPSGGVDSPVWSSCVARESRESPFDAASPDLIWSLAAIVVASAGVVFLFRISAWEGGSAAVSGAGGGGPHRRSGQVEASPGAER